MLHPTRSKLIDYSVGDLPDDVRRRIARHLMRCRACRSNVEELRRLLARVTRDAPRPPPELLGRILASRGAGADVILPAVEPNPPAPRTRPRFLAIAVVMTALIGASFWIGEAGAEKSRLEFSTTRLVPGQTLTVHYRSTGMLAGEDHLVLSVRFESGGAERGDPVISRVRLDAVEKRLFSGSISVPPGAAYAEFAVEDSGATRVDTNGQDPWTLMEFDGEQPSLRALQGRQRAVRSRDWYALAKAMRRATALYPTRPDAWADRLEYETVVSGGQLPPGRLVDYRSRLVELDHIWSDSTDAPQDVVAGMFRLSEAFGADSEYTVRWRERLFRQAPNHPVTFQVRAMTARRLRSPDRTLSALEEMWHDHGPHQAIAEFGYLGAQRAARTNEILRWANRYYELTPRARFGVAEDLTRWPALREEGTRKLRQLLHEGIESDDTQRPLHQTRSAARSLAKAWRADVMAALGRALAAQGDYDTALLTFDLSLSERWNPQLASSVSDIHLRRGDTLAAAPYLAERAADPLIDRQVGDSLGLLAMRAIGATEWEGQLERAQQRILESILRKVRPLSRPMRAVLRNESGEAVDISTLTSAPIILIAVWSPHWPQAVDRLARLQAERPRLADQHVAVIVIETETPPPEIRREIADRAITLPRLRDQAGELRTILNWWTTTRYFTVRDLRSVFESASLDGAMRAAYVLSPRDSTRASVVTSPGHDQ